MIYRALFIILNIVASAANAYTPLAQTPVIQGSFKIKVNERKAATCEKYSNGGVRISIRSMAAPGCILTLEYIDAGIDRASEKIGKEMVAYLSGGACSKKVGDKIDLKLHRPYCGKPVPKIMFNQNYCEPGDFDEPTKISDEKWACMVDNLWSEDKR